MKPPKHITVVSHQSFQPLNEPLKVSICLFRVLAFSTAKEPWGAKRNPNIWNWKFRGRYYWKHPPWDLIWKFYFFPSLVSKSFIAKNIICSKIFNFWKIINVYIAKVNIKLPLVLINWHSYCLYKSKYFHNRWFLLFDRTMRTLLLFPLLLLHVSLLIWLINEIKSDTISKVTCSPLLRVSFPPDSTTFLLSSQGSFGKGAFNGWIRIC